MLLGRRGIKKMPKFKQKLGFFEKWSLKRKGRTDGENGSFEGAEIVVEGTTKVVYHSTFIMEELAKFIMIRSQIYSGSQFNETKHTFRELINELRRKNTDLEMHLGDMMELDTKNYRTAKRELEMAQLDESRRKLHELTINHLESKVYNETKSYYAAMILNLETEIHLLEAFYDRVSNHFNYHQERISYYWHHALQLMTQLPAVPPHDWELLVLKREALFGEMEGVLQEKRLKIQQYQSKKDHLVPDGVIEGFLAYE